MGESWVKLYSKFKDWKWYKNQNIKSVFIHCLLSANWKESEFENIKISKGSFVTSLNGLARELGLSLQNVRSALKWLKSTQELTITSYKKFTVITVNNYEKYQEVNIKSNIQLTHSQHTTNTQLTTIEEYKNNRIIDIDERNNNACAREEIFEYDWLNGGEDERN